MRVLTKREEAMARAADRRDDEANMQSLLDENSALRKALKDIKVAVEQQVGSDDAAHCIEWQIADDALRN